MGDNSILPLSSICRNVFTLETLRIFGLSDLMRLLDCLFQKNPKLAHFALAYCSNLTNVASRLSGNASSLKILEIERSIVVCTSLESLLVKYCDELVDFLMDLQKLPSLMCLMIHRCPKLDMVPRGLCGLTRLSQLDLGYFLEFGSFQIIFNGIEQNLSSFYKLELFGCSDWDSLPDQLQYLTFLKQLSINDFGVETLLNWLGNIFSLETLRLFNCEKLHQLPSLEAMRDMIKLKEFTMTNCPLLQASCI
ncbi:uncharacterized protein LOC113766629 [Coffea eugenioides]|uniref:uncharacterized protein LOC113766629 n=1 Tax=Coffea eugenioides TaxID=49369 RepID=UPI000F61515F|nr:uncharacterized protein LOC113766629 [Coffea eugenioides]